MEGAMHTYIHPKHGNNYEIVITSHESKNYPTHLHETSFIIGRITMGSITITSEKQSDLYTVNDYYIIPPRKPHALIVNEPYSSLCLCIETNVLNDSESPSNSPFESIKAFIKNNITDKNSLTTLASLSSYSKYHFERKFKKAVGLSPYDYQTQAKIKYAKYLLTHNMPIAKVAADLGFTDQSHFNRCFKKYMGATPGQYIHSFYEF